MGLWPRRRGVVAEMTLWRMERGDKDEVMIQELLEQQKRAVGARESVSDEARRERMRNVCKRGVLSDVLRLATCQWL
jgi:hypothetical protein